ncbi:MAG TPA: MXAN_6640 family putative metalloprotease [Actinomycetota bacterium]
MRRAIVVLVVAGVLGGSVAGARAAGEPVDRRATTRTSEAQRVLADARTALRGTAADRARVSAPALRRDATMILRDLLLVRGDLSPADRRVADGLLARPTDGNQDPFHDGYSGPALASIRDTCTEATTSDLCVHWVEVSGDAPPLADPSGNGIPDWVDTTAGVFDDVWTHEIDVLGFRPPKRDGGSTDPGPNNKLDVYLVNLRPEGLYGYCTSDDPHGRPGSAYRFWDLSAYCVIDEDFVGYPRSPLKSLQATAAHEFFHASQFAYDVAEDLWLMEGTATWMEDEVFDAVNDHLQFNRSSQLRTPWIPVDQGAGGYRYGAWIFWRFLSERFDPGIVHRVWSQADGAPGGRDLYSLTAAIAAIKSRGSSFARAFAGFGAWNVWPAARYEEGDRYGVPRVTRTHGVTRENGGTPWSDLTLDHLSHREVAFEPRAGVRNDARLRVRIDGPAPKAGTAGTVVVRFDDGRVRFLPLHVNGHGEATRIVPFGRDAVRSATLVLTNTSTRTTCGRQTLFACQGRPRDDDQRFSYTAALLG